MSETQDQSKAWETEDINFSPTNICRLSLDSAMAMRPVKLVQSRDETVSGWVQTCGEDGELPNVHLQDLEIWRLE